MAVPFRDSDEFFFEPIRHSQKLLLIGRVMGFATGRKNTFGGGVELNCVSSLNMLLGCKALGLVCVRLASAAARILSLMVRSSSLTATWLALVKARLVVDGSATQVTDRETSGIWPSSVVAGISRWVIGTAVACRDNVHQSFNSDRMYDTVSL